MSEDLSFSCLMTDISYHSTELVVANLRRRLFGKTFGSGENVESLYF